MLDGQDWMALEAEEGFAEFWGGPVDPYRRIAEALGQPTPSAREGAGIASAGIASVGMALPTRVVENEEIGTPLGVDAEWIRSRTGVSERRRSSDPDSLAALGSEAAAAALGRSEVRAEDVDLVLVASFTQDALQPNAAPVIAERIGADGAVALDLGAACTGFLAALALATAHLEAGRGVAALVVGADVMSRVVDYSDRKTAGLFGDGAGAAVLTAGGPGRVGEIVLRSDGARSELITASHDERLLRMEGRATFRAAVAALAAATRQVVSDAQLSLEEIDLFVFHQANSRITAAVGERLELPAERVVDCIERYGNTSAASLPIALCDAAERGLLRPGSRVLLGAFGAGISWGAGIIEWEGSA